MLHVGHVLPLDRCTTGCILYPVHVTVEVLEVLEKYSTNYLVLILIYFIELHNSFGRFFLSCPFASFSILRSVSMQPHPLVNIQQVVPE